MYLVHGHVHMRYGVEQIREREYAETRVINASGRYDLVIPEGNFPEKRRNQIVWRTKYRDPYRKD